MSGLTRREFGFGLLGGIGALAFGKPSGDKVKPSVVGGVKIGVQSYTFRTFSVDKMIATMQAIGISYVELWDGHLNPMKASEDEYRAAKKKFDDAGIQVGAYCVNFPVTASDEYLDRGFKGALLLGTSVMTASVKKPIVPKLDEWCQKYKIKLGLHNHWFGNNFKGDRSAEFETPDDFLNALKGRSEYLSINLDIGHFSAAGFDPVAFFKEHRNRIVSLHLKDRAGDTEHAHRRFGEGATPITEVLKLAAKHRWPYVANIEYEPEPQDPTESVRLAYGYVKHALA